MSVCRRMPVAPRPNQAHNRVICPVGSFSCFFCSYFSFSADFSGALFFGERCWGAEVASAAAEIGAVAEAGVAEAASGAVGLVALAVAVQVVGARVGAGDCARFR